MSSPKIHLASNGNEINSGNSPHEGTLIPK